MRRELVRVVNVYEFVLVTPSTPVKIYEIKLVSSAGL